MPTGKSISLATYVLLAITPLFFSTNLIFGRMAIETIDPWTLAFLRWSFAAIVIFPFARSNVTSNRHVIIQHWKLLGTAGFLGMWICGALVYYALKSTTATNGTLIYSSAPIMILLLEWRFRGRKIGSKEIAGIILGIVGISIIITHGDPGRLIALEFAAGDLIFVLAALAWAIYSIVLKTHALQQFSTMASFFVIAVFGSLILLPFAAYETFHTGSFPTTKDQWIIISCIVVFASVLAFLLYKYCIRITDPSVTGIFMYLMPPYGVFMAVTFLGESFHLYHAAGIATVMSGVVIATFPSKLLTRWRISS